MCGIISTTNSSTMACQPIGLKPLPMVHWQKIMAGGAEMWLKFAFMVEVYINRSVLIFPHLFLISAESSIYFSATFKMVFILNFKFHYVLFL